VNSGVSITPYAVTMQAGMGFAIGGLELKAETTSSRL